MKNNIFFILIAFTLLVACRNETTTTDEPLVVVVPKFNADSAYTFVAKQVDFGPRVPNTDAHKACAQWLMKEMERFGASSVIGQEFQATAYTGEVLNSTNIIATFNPEHTERILLCAHWDSRHIADWDDDPTLKDNPILGADDGGSGVGVLMEVARIIGANEVPIGIDIVFFDAEDHGAPSGSELGDETSWCLGAQHWAANPHVPAYRAKYGILLDMVGSSFPKFSKEGTSLTYAKNVMDEVWDLAAELGYGTFFDPNPTRGVIDDHLFINKIAQIPTIDIINRDLTRGTGFAPHWHTHKDDMSVIDKNSLRMVGRLILEVLYREAEGDFVTLGS